MTSAEWIESELCFVRKRNLGCQRMRIYDGFHFMMSFVPGALCSGVHTQIICGGHEQNPPPSTSYYDYTGRICRHNVYSGLAYLPVDYRLYSMNYLYVTVLVQVYSKTVRVVFVEVYRLGSPFIIPLAREIE